ncbi:MAG: YebC/PmpR family DNA-binding transcriptional regulator [Anaerolineaceae bacterium]|nr:YebC/PmpR family DNA-binding transcriptional regulator [Anaerolineaceae bacterium]
MSGHSKWSTIKRKKGAADAKRGQLFTRLAREIAVAAREGGGDPDGNFKLRLSVDRARAANMPKDSIDRAIKRGSGEGKDGLVIEELVYEGYAPNGVALMIECLTENRNRTVSEIRHALAKAGGSMGEIGSVGWQFTKFSYFTFPSDNKDFDEIFEMAVEGGADDVNEDGGVIEIIGPADTFKVLSDMLRAANIQPEEAELRQVPNQEIELPVDKTLQVMRTIETIEDLDDVSNVYSNLKISEEAISALENA